jgi:hypothetical protein
MATSRRSQWFITSLAITLVVFAGCVSDDPHTIVPSLGAGGGNIPCGGPADCPGSDTGCRTRTCESFVCGYEDAPAGSPCGESGGTVCDGNGACVMPGCTDGVQNGSESDVDCGGPDCPGCAHGSICFENGDCASNFCDGTGGAGGVGGAAGGAGSTVAGVCAPCSDESDCAPNACDDGVCGSICQDDEDCATTAWCDDGHCAAKKPEGEDCAAAVECTSGFCADGVCCDKACLGGCEACDVLETGTCTTFAAGAPGSPSCSPYLCDGTSAACPQGCSGDGDCASNHFCDGVACLAIKANGAACAGNTECTSGFCVDGICCNGACSNACDACNVPGNEGTCAPKLDGTPGEPPCNPYLCNGSIVTCPNSCAVSAHCVAGYYCGGSQCLPLQPNGTTCAANSACASGHCVDGVCCNSACAASCDTCNLPSSLGTCTTSPVASTGNPSCAPYVCDGASTTCPSTCVTNIDCAPGSFCDAGGNCVGTKPIGSVCTNAAECQSGNCADGYCCNSACNGSCNACNISGSLGTCTPVPDGSPGAPGCDPYLCNGLLSSCPSSCVTGADCTVGNYCNAFNQCVAKKGNGTACGGPSECQSGFCVDGYCCDGGCPGSCDACNVAGSLGSCVPTPAGAFGSPSCAPYLCNGANTSCPSTCTSDASCAAGHYCNAQSQCVTKSLNGIACSAGNQCQSGNCIDGYCCNTACGGGCDACNVSGALGTCTVVPAGSGGNPSCTPYVCNGANSSCPVSCTSDANCASGNYCAAGACVVKKANGATCTGANQCQSSFCVDGYCCDGACGASCDACNLSGNQGTCTVMSAGANGSPSCTPYVCNGSSATCPGSCTSDAGCGSGSYCSGGACVAKQGNGTACSSSTACLSGFCVDGYCCNAACSASCDRCNVAGNIGTCVVSPDGDPGSPSCTPYLCDGISTSCPATCASSADCSGGNFCSGNQCTGQKANGGTCTTGSDCQSGLCIDGYCCNSTCSSSCDACNLSGSLGTCTVMPSGSTGSPSCAPYVCNGTSASCPGSCTSNAQCTSGTYCSGGACVSKKLNGNTCSSANECQSGNCVDGYCCNTACGSSCDACNVSGALGTCTVVPSGSTGSPNCSPYVCNGTNASCPGSCTIDANCSTGYFCSGGACVVKKTNGSTCSGASECQSGFCVDGYCCNGACSGSCNACNLSGNLGSCTNVSAGSAGAPSCSPYVCSGTSASCPSSCSGDSQCASGFYCSGGTCVSKKTNGTTCSAANQCQSGNCVDGYCCNSACGGSCDACNVSGSLGSCTVVSGGSPGAPSCSPYLCNGANASCPSSCTGDANCATGFYCNGTTCAPKQSNGASCSGNSQCSSGFCVDGVCCNNACNGACNACNLSGSQGTCTNMPSGSAGNPSCSPYVCSGSSASCPSSCTNNNQCTAGFTCSGGSCVSGGGCPVCTGDCDGIGANGCETNTCAHHDHCGGCGSPCNANQYCNNASCSSCPAGQRDCDLNGSNGCETTVASNSLHCGACGNACGSDGTCACSSGSCTGGTIYFSEDFSDNLKGWTLEGEWGIGPTAVSSGQQQGSGDPASDHSPSSDNGVAGIVVPGNYSNAVHAPYYLTSPAVNLGGVPGTVKLSFWRWLNCDYQPYVTATIDVWNGTSWVSIWQNPSNTLTADSAWTRLEFDVTAYKNPAFKVRFGHQVDQQGMFLAWIMSGWNVDDLTLASGTCQ